MNTARFMFLVMFIWMGAVGMGTFFWLIGTRAWESRSMWVPLLMGVWK